MGRSGGQNLPSQSHGHSEFVLERLHGPFHAFLSVILHMHQAPGTSVIHCFHLITSQGAKRWTVVRTYSKTPNRHTAHETAIGAQSKRLEDVGAATDSAVDADLDAPFCGRRTFRQRLDRRGDAVELSSAVVRDDHAVQSVLDGQLDVLGAVDYQNSMDRQHAISLGGERRRRRDIEAASAVKLTSFQPDLQLGIGLDPGDHRVPRVTGVAADEMIRPHFAVVLGVRVLRRGREARQIRQRQVVGQFHLLA